MRETGLDGLEQLPWGSHCCQFYDSKQDLIDTLVPYFSAGLRNNEACLWVTCDPLPAEEARDILARAVPELGGQIERGQIEIRDVGEWYTAGRRFDAKDVLDSWLERERRACAGGYSGLRLTGNTFWLEREVWRDFMDYEARVNSAFAQRRIIALCTYCMQKCSAHDVIEVVRNHQFALARREGAWEILESASRRTQELEEALRGRDQFLAMLGHELRGPLAPIRTAAQLVRLLAPSDANLTSASDVLDRQVQQLSRLVDDLLEGARITHGVITLRKECLAVDSLITRSVEAAQPAMAAHRHSLSFSLPGEALHVNVDPARLAQVLGNLLDNAAKYTPEGGTVEVSARREGADAVIRVRDSGMGIPVEMLGRIFDVFTQIDPTVDRAKGGLGLGLALVRRLVEMHGGRVEVHSDGRDRGAEFVVRLPLAEPPAEAPAPQRRAVATRRRILVVDDNSDSTTTLAMTLKLLGHEVRTALNGGGAIKQAKEFRPEVVLLDIGLPGMDGYEVARRLRELPATREARLIALTGYGRDEDRRRGREAGFDEYQLKPIAPETLQELLAIRSLH